jgi:hypothetical protein
VTMKNIDAEILKDLQVLSRDSSVGIATCYWLDGSGIGIRFSAGTRVPFSPQRTDRP